MLVVAVVVVVLAVVVIVSEWKANVLTFFVMV